MKKIIFFLCTLLCLNVLFAQTTFTIGDLTYEVTGTNEVEVHDCDISGIGEIEIPSIVNNYSVTSIGESAFKDCSSLTSVTIPNSVTFIESGAFHRLYLEAQNNQKQPEITKYKPLIISVF